MKKLLLFPVLLLFVACAKEVPATVENINSIFNTEDFSIDFALSEKETQTMSFIDDILTLKTTDGTQRFSISFRDAEEINHFIAFQNKNLRTDDAEYPSITIRSDFKKVVLKTQDFSADYQLLLNSLSFKQ